MMNYAAILDVTQYPSRFKHAAIFSLLETLPPDLTILIKNDHDPKPLYYQIQAEHPNEFKWEYVEQGPEIWQVAIGRLKQEPSFQPAVPTELRLT